jgi:tetratricopeptide (TPR) repeat protein
VATLAVPLVLLLALEAGLRFTLAERLGDDAYLNLVDVPSFFAVREVAGRRVVQVTHPEAYRGRRIAFSAQKDPGTLRIFCLGGSASAGWPHPPGEIYSAYLEQALARSFPDLDFEVINVGAHAYAAYRVRLILEQVLRFEPDLVVLYSGNNEFLEHRRYLALSSALARTVTLASHSVLFRWLRSTIVSSFFPENSLSARRREGALEGLASKMQQQALELRRDPMQLARVEEHYAHSLRSMVEAARRAGVPVVLATVPVNLRDWRPNASLNRLDGEDLERWQEAFDGGRAALLQEDPERALRSLAAAAELEPLHAWTYFLMGRAHALGGDPGRARESYGRARDLDQNPFRALSSFNDTVRRLAAESDGTHLADLAAAFGQASAAGGPGFDLFLDYVHPTVAGNRLVARTVFDAMVGGGLPVLRGTSAVFVAAEPSAYDEIRDVRLQTTIFALMGVMHQYDAMIAAARRLHAQGSTLPIVEEVLEVFPEYVALERQRLLALPVDPARARRAEARYRRFYKR